LVYTLQCNSNEDCTIKCSDNFACRGIDIYGPSGSNYDLSFNLECSSTYACYGATVHSDKLKSLKVTCSDFWSCAYMTVDGASSQQVSVHATEDTGYYGLGSAAIYCPNNVKDEQCSITCDGERSCFHSKVYCTDGANSNTCNVGCNGLLSCKYTAINCNYDATNELWKDSCMMSCTDNYSCACQDGVSCA